MMMMMMFFIITLFCCILCYSFLGDNKIGCSLTNKAKFYTRQVGFVTIYSFTS